MESNSGYEYSEADRAAAQELLGSSEILSSDEYAKSVVETGTASNGKTVDVGNFLAAREAFLLSEMSKVKLAAAEKRDPTAYEAAHSVRPDLEKYAA